MLLHVIIFMALSKVICIEENKDRKPYIVFPLPFDLPNRNDRAVQCWIRIVDEDLVETVAVYCHIALEFVRLYINEYNARKMTEDDVDVSRWNDEPLSQGDVLRVPDSGQNIKHWKTTTVLDPTTHLRLYVTQNATCEVIMYSREGVTNYRVQCDKILYFVNSHMNGGHKIHNVQSVWIALIVVYLFQI